MRHVFRATKMGWSKEQEGVWFDANHYTKDQAAAQFKPFKAISQKGYPYTGYEYDGQKYHDVTYLGAFANNKMPKNNTDFISSLLKKRNK